ncbi:MAG: M56 family metallopeptidase/LCP family protein [Clostridia bacterium]|nr:M56 family metallopeptidase/LCP family protein [Clostridia bacterium]
MSQIFTSILLTSAIGAALALILSLLQPVTRKVFSGGWHYYMWLVVLMVMVLPIRLTLPEKTVTTPHISETVTITDNQAENIETPIIIETQPEQVINEEPTQSEKVSTVQAIKDFLSGKVLLFSFTWLIGAALLFLAKIVSYLVFLIKIHKHSELISCPEIKAYTNRKIKTRVSDTICSPLMIGLIRPTLLLPKTDITPEQLQNVLAHEMTHLKRNDILYKWFVIIVKCIHWFNPAIYLISKQINIDCEISCDLAVVKKMNEQQEKGYVETILSLLTHNNIKAIPLTTGMTGNKKTLKRRFTMIKNKVKISKKTVIISIVLAIVILCGTVLASGLLNGKFLNEYKNELLAVSTDARENDNFNFLVLGVDENNRADTIMLLSFENGNVTGTSIPRDTAFISRGLDRKVKLSEILNSENGNQKVIDAVRDTLSVPITYYAKVNLSAVKEIVDSVGGIDIDVPMDMEYDDPHKNLHIKLKQGRQTLNGEAACGLLQFRRSNNGTGYSQGDMTRIEVGQQVISEFIKQKLNKEFIDKSPDIFKILADNLETNYPISNLVNDIKLLEKMKSNIKFRTIEGNLAADDTGVLFYAVDFNNSSVFFKS